MPKYTGKIILKKCHYKSKIIYGRPYIGTLSKLRQCQQKIKGDVRVRDIELKVYETTKENIIRAYNELMLEKKKYSNFFIADKLYFENKGKHSDDFS